MIQQIYSVKDIKIGTFNTPFFSSHDEQAKRTVAQALKQEESLLSQYPADYELYNLGTYDDKGTFDTKSPEFMVQLLSLMETHLNVRQEAPKKGPTLPPTAVKNGGYPKT